MNDSYGIIEDMESGDFWLADIDDVEDLDDLDASDDSEDGLEDSIYEASGDIPAGDLGISLDQIDTGLLGDEEITGEQIGRASCRERV